MPIYTEIFAQKRFEEHEQWLKDNLLYETIVGSQAYGLATPESDIDIVAIVMPLEQHIYPQRYGYVLGFDEIPTFENKEVKNEKRRILLEDGRDVEGEWNSLIRFFYLTLVKGSPNLIECLYTERNLVTFSTDIGWKLRDNRDKFLSVRTFNAFKGYAFGQLHRMRLDINRGKTENPKRQSMLEQFRMDTKMGSQVLRLLDQLNQMLDDGTIDLMKNKEEAKAMRKGEWGTWERFQTHVVERIADLEMKAINQTKLAKEPRIKELKPLLKEALEDWYDNEVSASKRTEYISVKDMMQELEKMTSKIDYIYKRLS